MVAMKGALRDADVRLSVCLCLSPEHYTALCSRPHGFTIVLQRLVAAPAARAKEIL